MAFEKRTWLARIGTGLNKFIIGDKDANNKQTLTNSPDTVSQQGDVISAENLNDLEDRIDDEFTSQNTRISENETAIGNLNTEVANKIGVDDLKIESVNGTTSISAMSQGNYGITNLNFQISAGYKVIGIVGFVLLVLSSGTALDVAVAGVEVGDSSATFTIVANESIPDSTGFARLRLLCQKTS